MKYININGKLVPSSETVLYADNRAFRYGYGLFETMLVQDGTIALAASHWERLFHGMQELCFDIPAHCRPASLQEEVLRCVRKNKQEKCCRVRLQIYAGNGGLLDAAGIRPEFVIECFDLEPAVYAWNENGLVTGIATGLQKSSDTLAPLKTASSLIYALAAQQAKQHKWNDALICNTNGNIIESTIANLFWVNNEQIFTPPLADGCIAGVMRKYLIEKLHILGIPVTEQTCDTETLLHADELFLTNAIRRIKWIGTCSEQLYNQAFTRHLYYQLFPFV